MASIIPVNPPTVNKNTNPKAHKIGVLNFKFDPWSVASHLKILIPVGTAIIIVAEVKYARVSMSMPTVNIWCAHTMKPKSPMANIA